MRLRYKGTPVDYATAQMRVLLYLRNHSGLSAAGMIAIAIWPDASFKAQGAGGSAARILKRMAKDGLVRWNSDGHQSWGYELTAKGRQIAEEEAQARAEQGKP